MRINMMRVLANIVIPVGVLSSWVSILTTDPVGRKQPGGCCAKPWALFAARCSVVSTAR